MRVLAIGNLYPPAATGGYERIWAATMAALSAAGHETRMLTTAQAPGAGIEGGDEPGVARELRWYWHDFDWPRLSPPARLAIERHNRVVLRRHLRAFAPDVVSWWGMGGMSLSLVEQVRRAGVPAVGVVADAWMTYGPARDGWTRAWSTRPRRARIAERLSGVPARPDLGAGAQWLFISRFVRDGAVAAGVDLRAEGLAHPGVDPDRFPPSPPPPWSWRLLYAGRVEPVKGVATAIRALAELPAEAQLTIDGPGPEAHLEELRALALRCGVQSRVRFARSAPGAMGAAYAAADAVVFPVTWEEPWGLVPLEAMAVGRPVVATGTGGSREYLADGENCLLFPPDDPRTLAARLRRLAGDPTLRERVVEGGRRTAATYTEAAFEATVVDALAAACRARSPGS
jgi:glycosyltransferase involved in cell wall biosynthesis